jgi:hypothetical protein
VVRQRLPGAGSARYSRELEVPAHRGHHRPAGRGLAISTPGLVAVGVPAKFDPTPAQVAELAKVLEITPRRFRRVDPTRTSPTRSSCRPRWPTARWRCGSPA